MVHDEDVIDPECEKLVVLFYTPNVRGVSIHIVRESKFLISQLYSRSFCFAVEGEFKKKGIIEGYFIKRGALLLWLCRNRMISGCMRTCDAIDCQTIASEMHTIDELTAPPVEICHIDKPPLPAVWASHDRGLPRRFQLVFGNYLRLIPRPTHIGT